jgi:hypothetical protein
VPFALEFSDNVDPTALATVLLAVLTFATVVVGAIALHRTRSEIDLSRREVEEAHRPVLIPFDGEAQTADSSGAIVLHRVKPYYREHNRVMVPIKNIGSGPALNIDVFLVPLEGMDLPTQTDPPHFPATRLLGLGTSELTTVIVEVPEMTELTDFAVTLDYVDVAGKRWRTNADYNAVGDGAYEAMSIEARPHTSKRPDGVAAGEDGPTNGPTGTSETGG